MSPEQSTPQASAPQPPTMTQQPTPEKKSRAPLVLMVLPIAMLAFVFTLYALVNVLTLDRAPADGELFGSTPPIKSAINVALYFLGALSVIFGPISFIVGLVLFIKQKSRQNAQD